MVRTRDGAARRRRDRPEKPAADKNAGVIREDEAYTLEALKRRLDLTDSAWWALLEQGFPHKRLGKRRFILGREVLRFLEGLPDAQSAEN